MSVLGLALPRLSLSAYCCGEFKQVNLEDYLGQTLILVFYPLDFTFVCPTEIIGFSKARSEFSKVGAEVLLVSCDSVYSHKAWAERKDGGIYGHGLPMLSDCNGGLSRAFGIYKEDEGRSYRATIILKNGVVVYELVHADPIGRSTKEILRVVKALKFNEEHGDICPLDWNEEEEGKEVTAMDGIKVLDDSGRARQVAAETSSTDPSGNATTDG
ncbi:peroxiredoxin 2/4 [Nematocida homosporus]|uniref:peroxiredoxin 2/4 n=1 Tax=Nematocida homosporus TaxID=1912981 RepID=UPI0022204E68|nr:peroxiredoxin 2/4 [Nematocida homosporus]KAI5184281.1 peroxiredoxin 2/4 [Nematocida homosporus]